MTDRLWSGMWSTARVVPWRRFQAAGRSRLWLPMGKQVRNVGSSTRSGFAEQTLMRSFWIIFGWLILVSPGLADPAESISAFRRAHGMSAVQPDPTLMRLAREQAQAMAASENMDHSVKGSFSSRISEYPTRHAAENIAMGNATF